MALCAGNVSVRTGEGEGTHGVIEGGRAPTVGSVAERAVCWKSGRDVVGSGCAGEVFLMARVAGRRCGFEIIVCVALCAGYAGMHTG